MTGNDRNEWDDTIGDAFETVRSSFTGGLSEREINAGAGAITYIDEDLTLLYLDRVEKSRIIPAVTEWRRVDFVASGKHPGGPKPLLTDTVILTIALILAVEGCTVRILDIQRAIESRLTPGARRALGIEHLFVKERNWYFLVHRAAHRLLATWDAWGANDGFKRNNHTAMTLEQRVAWEAAQDLEFLDQMRKRGDWFINALVEMSLRQQSPQFQSMTTAGSIDQTAVLSGTQQARWKRDKKSQVEIPKGNLYTGEVEEKRVLALEADWVPKKKGAKKRDADAETTVSQLKWVQAYMANVLIDVAEDPTADKTELPPQLIRAASFGTPNKRVAEHTLGLLDSLEARGRSLTRLTFDRGYSQLTDAFHLELIDRGIPVVKDYLERQKGIAEDSIGGSLMYNDRYMCPSTPDSALAAHEKFELGQLTREELWVEQKKLEKYELHVHDRKEDGTLRLSCPATGISPTASCPLQALHRNAIPDEDADRVRIYRRDITELQDEYKVCKQHSITVKATAHPQRRQKFRHNGQEWTRTYRADRNSIESTNDLLQKDMKLENSANRPMRGLAAQQFAFGLIVFASNMRRITNHEHDQAVAARRAAAGRILRPRKPRAERLQRSRDRRGETRYMKNPPPRKLVPLDELVTPPPAPPVRKPRKKRE